MSEHDYQREGFLRQRITEIFERPAESGGDLDDIGLDGDRDLGADRDLGGNEDGDE